MKKTHRSLSMWLTPKVKEKVNHNLKEVPKEKELIEKEKEEKLELVRRKKMAWLPSAISRSIILEVVGEATRRAEMAHCGYLDKMMVDMVWLERETLHQVV